MRCTTVAAAPFSGAKPLNSSRQALGTGDDSGGVWEVAADPVAAAAENIGRRRDRGRRALNDMENSIVGGDLCGIDEGSSLSPLCQSLNVLNSPYTCQEVRQRIMIRTAVKLHAS